MIVNFQNNAIFKICPFYIEMIPFWTVVICKNGYHSNDWSPYSLKMYNSSQGICFDMVVKIVLYS